MGYRPQGAGCRFEACSLELVAGDSNLTGRKK